MPGELDLHFDDGTTRASWAPPWKMREQVDWEQHFRQAFTTVYTAIGMEQRAAELAMAVAGVNPDPDGDEDQTADASTSGAALAEAPASHFRVTWMLWFCWHRLRASRQAPAKFETWLDQLNDYDFVEEEPAADPDPEPVAVAAEPEQGSGVDPTVSPSPASPPVTETAATEPAAEAAPPAAP